jgi:hypothetical protein
VKTSFSSAPLQNGMPCARQKARWHLLQDDPPLPAARDSRRLLRGWSAGDDPCDEGVLFGPSWIMVLLLKQVHLQKDGGAEMRVSKGCVKVVLIHTSRNCETYECAE